MCWLGRSCGIHRKRDWGRKSLASDRLMQERRVLLVDGWARARDEKETKGWKTREVKCEAKGKL